MQILRLLRILPPRWGEYFLSSFPGVVDAALLDPALISLIPAGILNDPN
jgi:hypothetical protein